MGRYFVNGGPIDMNIDEFWETSVGFLKCVVLKLFPKVMSIWMSKSRAKFNGLGEIRNICSVEGIGQFILPSFQ